jgi:hypothetical protein
MVMAVVMIMVMPAAAGVVGGVMMRMIVRGSGAEEGVGHCASRFVGSVWT